MARHCARRGCDRPRRSLVGRQDHPRPVGRHHRPRAGLAQDRPQPAAIAARSAAQGGKVVVVLGNHEAMNLLGDNRYTTPGEYAAFVDGQSAARRDRVYAANRAQLEASDKAQNPKSRPTRSAPTGWPSIRSAGSSTGSPGVRRASSVNGRRATLRSLKIGGTLFVHGGISAEYAKQPLDDVNKRVAAAMARATTARVDPRPIRSVRYGIAGWSRPTPRRRRPAPRSSRRRRPHLRSGADRGARRLWRTAAGHRPHAEPEGHPDHPDGRLARIDTGNSRYYGGPLSWLEIIGDRMTAHTVPRSP